MVRSRGLRPANGASCAVGLMMLIFFLGAAQAVPLYKMNNEIVNDNNSILDSERLGEVNIWSNTRGN